MGSKSKSQGMLKQPNLCWVVAVMLSGVLRCGSAFAFSEDSGNDVSEDTPYQQSGSSSPSSYNFSNNAFSVTMSRNQSESGIDGSAPQTADQAEAKPAPHPRRSLFQRMIHGIFGGN